MSSKVPCGGFKLDENFLGMNENDELSLVGGSGEGKAYQQLVTDGTGKATWEDKMVVDSELSDTSTNPVQNKVVKSALDAKLGVYDVTFTVDGMTGEISADKTFDEIKTAYDSGLFVLAKNVVSFEDVHIIRGFSATCNYIPATNRIYFTFAFGQSLGDYNYGSVIIGSISIDSNNNVVVNDTNSLIKNFATGIGIIMESSTAGSSKRFRIAVDDSGTISATEVTS